MLGRQALAVSSLNAKKVPQKVQTLEQLAMDQYLMLLQGACSGYVSLLKVNSYLLDQVRDNILATLKSQLSQNLFGTMSTVLRQAMIDSVLSGKYPTKSYYSTYDPMTDSLESVEDFGTEADRAILETIRKHGKKCNSVCCTGAFIIETMLSVLVSEDIRVLKFEKPSSQIFWNRDRFLRKYVPLQIPAILAHYDKAIKDTEDIKKPRLEKFVIKDSNIISRSFAIRHSHFDVLTTYNDTSAYLEIPGFLSAAADPDNPVQYGGFSEHLMMMIGEVFRGLNRFERMTEIYLDSEACNTLLKMSNQYNRCISHELFAGIGVSCPNLKVLDLSNAIAISADSLIQLIFRHAYTILHQFVYLPEYKLSDRDSIAQVLTCPLSNIYRHDLTRYCPYCEDEWCCNGVRSGVEFADVKTPIVDDRLYKEIQSKQGEMAKKYLINVVKASDLIKAMDTPRWELVRPKGPEPWEEGFVPPTGKLPVNDNGCLWYMPDEIVYRAEAGTPIINDIANSLQCLKLNSDNFHPKHEIVPFLLKALPKVKTLGRVKVVKGLKMIRDIPELNGIVASHLEELDMTFGGHDICSIDTTWADEEINDLVVEFGERLSFNPSSVNGENENLISELRSNFAEDVRLVAEQCPRLKSLRLSIFGETVFLQHDDLEIWQPVGCRLLALRELMIQAHTWKDLKVYLSSFWVVFKVGGRQEVSGLLSIVGSRLTKLNLMLEGRGQAVNDVQAAINESQVPKLESVLHRCTNLEHLTLSFGMRSVDVTQQEMESLSASHPFRTLKTFTVHTYMTKRALEYLWARAVNLESIRIPYTLVTADNFPHELVEFTEADVTRLLRTNKMRQLRHCCTSLTFKSIESAKCFIDNLSSATEISKLSIIVGLQEDHYPSEEQMFFALAQVMQSMRKFKLFCSEKSKLGQKIKWRWARTGALESLAPANLGPLQGLVDMSDDEA